MRILKSYAMCGLAAGICFAEMYVNYMAAYSMLDVSVGNILFTIGIIFCTFAGSIFPEYENDSSELVESAMMEWGERLKPENEKNENGIAHSLVGVMGSTVVTFGLVLVLALIFDWQKEWKCVLVLSFFAGQILHMVIDILGKGIRIFLPFCKVKIRIPLIRNLLTEYIATILIVGTFLYIAAVYIPGSLI